MRSGMGLAYICLYLEPLGRLRKLNMKVLGSLVGVAALLAAGSADATIVYNTITGQTVANSNLLTTSPGAHAPLGADFTAPYTETIDSVGLNLYVPGGSGFATDAGSVQVYLVPGTGSPSLPLASGLKLTNPVYLGTILDTSLQQGTGNSVANTITLNTNATIGAGTWWIELTTGSDPNNYFGTQNSTPSVAKWGEILAATSTGTIGVPTGGWYTSGSNYSGTGIIGGISNNSTSGSPSPNDEIFMMSIDVPEPTSLVLLSAGLIGLGFKRYRRPNKGSAA